MAKRTAGEIGPLVWLWRFVFMVAVLASLAFWLPSLSAANVARGTGPTMPWFGVAISAIQSLAMLGIAAMLLVRAANNRAALLLSAILLVQGASAGGMHADEPTAQLAAAFAIVMELIIGFAWPMFCLEISGARADRRQLRLATVAAVLFAVTAGLIRFAQMQGLPVYSPAMYPAFVIAHQAFGYALIAFNYRRNDAPARNRIAIVVAAFICLLIGVVLVNWSPGLWQSIALGVLRILAAGLLAYVILHRRLFDLGFVVNRTLVYAAVSFVLLAGFGLAEWTIKHLLPPEWTKDSAFYSAAIALLLFLSFHRLRDWIEHHIERLLFHEWHVNEAALRRFVASASGFESAAPLLPAFAAEVSRFAQGAPAALYLRDAANGYCRVAGKLPGSRACYPADERLFAVLRTERRPAEPASVHSELPGALAIPLLGQGALDGFVLVGAKTDGTRFRPDEVELLGWAVRDVALDLRALHARDLEARNLQLSIQAASLAAERDRLLAMLPAGEVRELRA